MPCTLLPTDDALSKHSSLEAATQVIVDGGLLAFATETVYGLGANALDDVACSAIFLAKGRPSLHPLIVHIANQETISKFARNVPDYAHRLARYFWPGPLTLILPRIPLVARCAAGVDSSLNGQDSENPTIGLRCPNHPLALALLERLQSKGVWGVAAPSANRFGRISPTSAQHVIDEFAQSDYSITILDGGACSIGVESTIVDCSRDLPTILRVGHITRTELEAVVQGPVAWPRTGDTTTPKAAGTLASHYAPRAKLRLVTPIAMQEPRLPHIAHLQLPSHPHEAEQVLFARMRALDHPGIEEIWVCPPPEEERWAAVYDRLVRAAHE